MEYLISSTDTYRVATVADVEVLHQALLADTHFTLVSFKYQTKVRKEKGEIVDEWQLVTAKKVFTDEKEPEVQMEISYKVGF